MNSQATTQVLSTEEAQEAASALMGQLATAQQALDLTTTEMAARTGLNRVTLQRVMSTKTDIRLESFVRVAAAVGLVPALKTQQEASGNTDETTVVHRGFSYARLRRDPTWRDSQREKALALAWENANHADTFGVSPVMRSLVPNFTQEQASAAATAIQWLGSEVGFEFLKEAMGAAGYAIVDKKTK